uniref:peroxidase n=1 Tax=Zea mays TaxID=4577 RepID=A0A804N785_MAIZE
YCLHCLPASLVCRLLNCIFACIAVRRSQLQGAAGSARQCELRDARGRPERAPAADGRRAGASRRAVLLSKINLDATDLVALSGGHTIGLGHCASFESRLFPRQDPTLNATFAGHLRRTCPAKGTDRRTPLDVRTPDAFDNKYYVNLVNREGLFTSDQDLFSNPGTRPLVEKFARSQRDFFDQFAFSVVKMGQIKVLTGAQGQIRRNCSARNAGMTWSVVDEAAQQSFVF